MKTKFLLTVALVMLVACEPTNQPIDNDLQITDSVSLSDPSPLIGEWIKSNNSKQHIEINDSLIIEYYTKTLVNRYTINGMTLQLERLFFSDSCCRFDTCAYRLVDDTLYIENFQLSPLATWPPTFNDVKYIRKR